MIEYTMNVLFMQQLYNTCEYYQRSPIRGVLPVFVCSSTLSLYVHVKLENV